MKDKEKIRILFTYHTTFSNSHVIFNPLEVLKQVFEDKIGIYSIRPNFRNLLVSTLFLLLFYCFFCSFDVLKTALPIIIASSEFTCHFWVTATLNQLFQGER